MAVERSMQVRLDMLVGDYIKAALMASKATEGIAAAAAKPKTALDRIGDAAKDVGQMVTSTAGLGVAALATWGASAFAAGAAFNTLQQTAGSALVTVLGSAEAASAQMAELIAFSKTSPFPRQLWIEAQQILLGFGFEAEKIVPMLSAIQDGMVAVGGSAQTIDEVVNILARVSSTGKVTAGDLSELGNRGIDAAAILGEAFGKSAGQIRDAVSAGTIDVDTFIDTLVTQMGTKYAGAAEGLRQTWVGAFDRIKGATRDVGSIMAEPFIDPQGGGAAVQWANDIADAIRALEAVMRPAMETLRDRAQPAFQAASEAAQRFAAALREVDLVAILDRLAAGAPVLLSFGAAAAAAGSSSALAAIGMGGLAATVSPLAAGLTTLAVVSPELRSALMDLLGAIAPLIPPATDLALELAELVTSGAGLAGSILSVLAPALSVLVSAITPLLQFTSGLLQVLDAVPGPALAAAAGVLALAKVLLMLRSFTGSLAIAGALDAAFTKTESGAKKAASAVGGFRNLLLGLGAGVIIGGVVALTNAFSDTADQLDRVRSVASSGVVEDLEYLARTGELSGGLSQLFNDGATAAEGFARSLDIATANASSWSDWWNVSGNERDAATESFKTLDAALAESVKAGQDADAAMRHLAEAYDLTDAQVEELLGLLPQYTAEAERQERANKDAADGTGEYEDGLAGVEEQAQATKKSLSDLADEMLAQTDPIFAAIKATQDLADAEAAYNDAVAEFGSGSDEANAAMLEMIEAKSKAVDAAAALAEITGGELTPEFEALAESLGLTSDDLAWLTGQVQENLEGAEDYRDALMDVNADLTESGGFMKARMALVYSGMSEDAAQWALSTKKTIDDMIADGMTYEEAIAAVAAGSGQSMETIEGWFQDARAAGLEFSDEYPAHISLTGVADVLNAADVVQRRLDAINRTVTISFQYENFVPRGGGRIPVSAEGRIARSPMLTWVAEAGHPESIISWDPKYRERSLQIWEETGRQLGAFSASTSAARPAIPSGGRSGPDHFMASAVIDLGEGVQQVVDIKFERHDRDLKRRATMGTGAYR